MNTSSPTLRNATQSDKELIASLYRSGITTTEIVNQMTSLGVGTDTGYLMSTSYVSKTAFSLGCDKRLKRPSKEEKAVAKAAARKAARALKAQDFIGVKSTNESNESGVISTIKDLIGSNLSDDSKILLTQALLKK